MDIVIGDISSIRKDPSEGNVTLPEGEKVIRKDRRKNKQDRRRSVREGIYVSLSVKNDRRVLRDRRRASS